MHVYDSPSGVNHVSYKSELSSFYPKNTKNIPTPPAFTFVREPLSHFVSGLAEYHFRCQHKKVVTANDIRQVLVAGQIFTNVNYSPRFHAAIVIILVGNQRYARL